ncbi:MAG: acyl carrier protein [Candidatus Omnitrophica bacterium]|nr:acyl carrier protein [Candidatus Omnitrophota bacterium]MBI2173824.1 acyl carrier protein [Candidatus Omnitrophota bacterium]MBI3010235.1 acyl carrier protein [Candidatus Omnitrophota bacterium]
MATESLLKFIQQLRGPDPSHQGPLTLQTPVFTEGSVDSMGLIELLAFVEREFGVVLDLRMEELRQLGTVEALAKVIEKQLTTRVSGQ